MHVTLSSVLGRIYHSLTVESVSYFKGHYEPKNVSILSMLFLCLVSEQAWFDLIWHVVFSCRHFIWRMMENVYTRMIGMVESLWTSNLLQKASLKVSKFYLKNDDNLIENVLLEKELWNNMRAFFKHLNNMVKELWLFSVVPEENLTLSHF